MKTYDCAVIGGGPAGMTSALYLARAGVNFAWIEKLSPGGQMLNTEVIDNYPGFPKGVRGYELSDIMAEHLSGFSYDKYNDEVIGIVNKPDRNTITIGSEEIDAKSVILCSGARFRKLGLPREEELTGRGVSYCALCDGNFFRDQVVAVVGGGNTALEESLYLTKLVKKVYLIHRRDEFRGDKIYQDKVIAEPKIEILYSTIIEELLGDKGLIGLRVANLAKKEEHTLELQGLFVFIGYEPTAGFLPPELDKDEWGFVVTDTEMQTNLPGLFAAGDIRSKRCRQVTSAVGDGATAANSAIIYLEQSHA